MIVMALIAVAVGTDLLGPLVAVAAPTSSTAPVTIADAGIPGSELIGRAKAFARAQALDPRSSSAYVAREAIDERWAVSDARAAGVLPSDASLDAALARGSGRTPLDQLGTFYGMTTPELRERVRGELSARALADSALFRTHSDAAYGRYFVDRAARRRLRTHCRPPFAPLDRCRYGRDHANEREFLMGIGVLTGRGNHVFEIDLAPLLGITSEAPDGSDYGEARRRLERAIAKRSTAIARRVHLSSDAYAVFVRGRRLDQFAVARIAHRLVIGHLTPVLL
jgi:hypothetical protein